MAYLARRFALSVLTLWLLTVATFFLLRIAPGDAVTAAVARSPGEGGLSAADSADLRKELGLDRNWLVQYTDWLGGMLILDPGTSLATGRTVADEISPRFSVTAELTLFAVLITVVIGMLAGLIAAHFAGDWPDAIIRVTAFAALSLPSFWLALILVVTVANWTGHFLALGYEPFSRSPAANLGAVLPAAALLAVRPGAVVTRITRASTLDSTTTQFFVLARAKGVSRQVAVVRHGFRTAMLPALTVIGAQAVLLLGGAIVIEQIFGLPGLGRLLIDSVSARDFPVVQSLVLIFGVTAIGVNLILDLVYVWLDPRLRSTE